MATEREQTEHDGLPTRGQPKMEPWHLMGIGLNELRYMIGKVET